MCVCAAPLTHAPRRDFSFSADFAREVKKKEEEKIASFNSAVYIVLRCRRRKYIEAGEVFFLSFSFRDVNFAGYEFL